MKFLVGILNSSLVAYWIQNKGKKQGELYKLDKEPLLEIPLPILDDTKQQPIINLVEQILILKEVNQQADTSILEKEIDTVVYNLYGLTEEEISIYKRGRNSHVNSNRKNIDLANYLELYRMFDVYQYTLPGHDKNLSKVNFSLLLVLIYICPL